MRESPPPARVRQQDPQYQRDAADEVAFWEHTQGLCLDAPDPRGANPFQRYTNRRFTDDPAVPWYATIARYGLFRNALVLGAAGIEQERVILETNPNAIVTFADLSEATVARRERDLGATFPGRVHGRARDLNFATFERSAYDLIVSSSTLHHLVNLEHAIDQINAALTDDGYFFLQDYVGEARFRFPAPKRRLFEILHERATRLRGEPPSKIEWLEAGGPDYSPFEAVRPDETLSLLRERMREVRLRTAGAVAGLFLYTRFLPASSADRSNTQRRSNPRLLSSIARLRRQRLERRLVRELLLIDELVCDSGVLLPTNAFGIYQKCP